MRCGLLRQFPKVCQRGHALINAGNTRFNFLSVGRNRIVEVGMEALGDAVDMRKNGGIIFRAEHNTVHLVRRQFITGHLMLEQGIAGKDIAFFKPLQQPAGVILTVSVRPPVLIIIACFY